MGIGEIGERLRRSTVHVRSGQTGSGSGVIWEAACDASTAIVTNAHVVRSGDLTVELRDGRTASARLDRRDIRRDLAIVRIEARGLEPARSGDSHRIRVGNSGGPLADTDGNVIGINTAIVPVTRSVTHNNCLGLAVPATAARHLLTSSPPVELGVTIRPVRIPAPHRGIALLVLAIAAGSPADYASLRPGDLLIGAGGQRFASADDLQQSLDHGIGQPMTIQFLRGGHPGQREATVRLIRRAAA